MPVVAAKARPRWLVPAAGGLLAAGLLAVLLTAGPGRRAGEAAGDEVDDRPSEMVQVPGGTFVMGNDAGAADERPAHEVTLAGFSVDKTEVTNGQFAAFVTATGYVTVSERTPDQTRYPGAEPGSAVFVAVEAPLNGPWETPHPPWWRYVPGASWRRPDGPGSSVRGRKDYPVVQIAWDDAAAYAKWAGKRLPTEAEWEYAARGGLHGQEFTWGSARQGDGGKWHANTFQGTFPHRDAAADGFAGLAPVAQFPPNGYGVRDMSGNVWEWCADFYDAGYYAHSPKENPAGPAAGEREAGQPLRVRRGGSFLCDDSYCGRYRPSPRDKNPADSGASHTGFRCVK